jgi:hypothetical protein
MSLYDDEPDDTLYYVYLDDTDVYTYDTLEEAEEGMERLRKSCIRYFANDRAPRTLEMWHGAFDSEEGEGFLISVVVDEGVTE